MKVILVYLQTKNIQLSKENLEFLKIFNVDTHIYLREINKNLESIEDTFQIKCYEGLFFNFQELQKSLQNYDYMFYLDDMWINDNLSKSHLETSLQILSASNYSQLFLTRLNHQYQEKKINQNSILVPIVSNCELDNYNLFERIVDHNQNLLVNSKNPFPKSKLKKMNYGNYLNQQYPLLNFNLVPSIIKISDLSWECPLLKNEYLERVYSLQLEKKNFKSVSINNYLDKILTPEPILVDNTYGDNITIVTGYLKLDTKRPPKRASQVYDYLDKAKATLSLQQNMVIYVSRCYVSFVSEFRQQLGLASKTKVVEINVPDNLYLYEQLDQVRQNVQKNIKPYNIPEYGLSVNSRYNLVKDAIENNYFQNDFYAWIDFSGGHIIDIPNSYKITYSKVDKIRLSWIARKNKQKGFVFNHKCCGGGVFLGHQKIMLELIKLHDREYRRLHQLGYNINDDKLLFILYELYPQMFDIYLSGYKSLVTKI